MNVYFFGMCVAMVLYVIIGFVISRKVRNANDFYVAGRRAPTFLIAGSIIASYASTGLFMGDAAQCYDGAFFPIILTIGMQNVGYIIGAVFFGRYLRRSRVMTIPQFFGKRFCSKPLQLLAAITAIITMMVYLLSVLQGVGTLMHVVTEVDYRVCIVIVAVSFTVLTAVAGSRGVLITDTLMAGVLTAAELLAIVVIAKNAGGWFTSIRQLAVDPEMGKMLSAGGNTVHGPLYDAGWKNIIWAINTGIVWMGVCMVGPWQSSRYLMAKDEHAVIRSAPISALGVFAIEFLVGMAAMIVHHFHPALESSSHVMIWAALNVLPTVLGVILLVGVLSAGISSATTFLSLIGSSVSNDIILPKLDGKNPDSDRRSIRIGQIAMVVASVVTLIFAVVNPPSIYWIMLLGGAIAACSWMPVAIASIFSKRVTKTGAFLGMLSGFLSCFLLKLYSSIKQVTLPFYLDPGMVGIVCNTIVLIIASALTQVSPEEKVAYQNLFVMPAQEKKSVEINKTLRWSKATILVGVTVMVMMIVFWIIPYYQGLMKK